MLNTVDEFDPLATKWFPFSELPHLLRVTPDTARKLIHENDWRTMKVGKRRYVLRSDLEDFLA
ncbi:helix-turn-helix domain-containing protein [Gordonia hongkongensis]|uniref:helix-turn-helix domain-containing protein n=1 Tax=Gordonia hongkongensis TaxID=1701090 RepID=UPI003D75DFD5